MSETQELKEVCERVEKGLQSCVMYCDARSVTDCGLHDSCDEIRAMLFEIRWRNKEVKKNGTVS